MNDGTNNETGNATDIATIIVNYRTADATVSATKAMVEELSSFSNPVVVVVDNDSRDGSSERLKDAFRGAPWIGRVAVLDSPRNGGYGYGINVGVRHALASGRSPRYLHVINPDALPDRGSIERLASFMEAHPEAGLAGGAIHDPSGAAEVRAFRFPSFWSELEGTANIGVLSWMLRERRVVMKPSESCEVDWIPGTSMLIRKEVFSTAGFFDEEFFLYFEEVDFARRVQQAGWKVCFVADAGIGHLGSLSTGMGDQTQRMPRYWFESRRRYFVKHHGTLYSAACDAAWICGHALYLAKLRLLRRPDMVRPRLWRDFLRYSATNVAKPAPRSSPEIDRNGSGEFIPPNTK
jgi:GT2 family glycosyltransferase